jgi:phosphate uptake regulator
MGRKAFDRELQRIQDEVLILGSMVDDEIDQLYSKVNWELLTFIAADPSPSTIDRANYLLWAAHNLERAADRVTNLCERVVFTVTGEMVELNVRDTRVTNLERSRL